MKKVLIFVLIAVIVGLISLSINTVTQNDASDESVEGENAEEPAPEPQGRNLSIELEEDFEFSTP